MMMQSRKKQLLNSFKVDDHVIATSQPVNGSGKSSSSPSGHVTAVGEAQMTSLNLNQSLTDQLTQRGRQPVSGNHVTSSAARSSGGTRVDGMSGIMSSPGHMSSNRTGQSHLIPDLDVGVELVGHRGSYRVRSPASGLQMSVGSTMSSSSLSMTSSCRPGSSSSGRRTQNTSGCESVNSNGGSLKSLPPRSQQSRSHSPAGLVGGVPSMRDISGHPCPPIASGISAGDMDATTLSRLAALHQASATLRLPLTAPGLLSPFLLQHDSTVTRQLEQLWQAKFPQRPVPPPWMLHQFQEELFRDTARLTAPCETREHIRDHRLERERERERERDRDRDRDRDHDRTGNRIPDESEQQLSAKDRHLDRVSSAGNKRSMQSDHRGVNMLTDRRSGPIAWDAPGSQHIPTSSTSLSASERRPERSLIVEQTVTCAADAVQQHFEESLLRLQANASSQKSFVSANSTTAAAPSVVPAPWNPALFSTNPSSSSPVGSTSAFAPPSSSFKKSPVLTDQQRKISGQDFQHAMSQQAQAAAPLMSVTGPYKRLSDERIKSEEKLAESKYRGDDRSRSDGRLKCEELIKYEDYSNCRDAKLKYEERSRFEEKMKSEDRLKAEDRMRGERMKYEDPSFKTGDKEDAIQMRPRPAHTGSANDGLSSNKNRATSSGRPLTGHSELNFNLYGYQPCQTAYISNEKLNHVMTVSNGIDARTDKASNVTAGAGPRILGGLADMTQAGDAISAKQTSVIVEHRRNASVLDGYRNRGSITQGTPGDPSLFRSAPNWFEGIPRNEQIPPDDRDRDRGWPVRSGRRPTGTNGMPWQQQSSSGQSSMSTSSPPSKSEVMQQGHTSNPQYNSSVSSAGIHSRTAGGQLVSRDRSSNVQSSSQMSNLQASYIDSFKSFVDRAVQSAFMEEANSTPDQMEPMRPVVSSVLQSLSGSPAGNLAMTGQSIASLPVTGRPNVDNDMIASVDMVGNSKNPTSGVSSPFSVASLTKSSSFPGSGGRCSGSQSLVSVVSEQQAAASSHGTSAMTTSPMPALMSSVVARSAPALVSSVSNSPPAPHFNSDPPLLIPQQPIGFQPQESPANSAITSSASVVDRQSGAAGAAGSSMGGDTDSDTLSAHSPAPLLVPMTNTPPPSSIAAAASGPNNWHPKFKKSWFLRYSDEDRKNTTPDETGQQTGGGSTTQHEHEDEKLVDIAEKLNDAKDTKSKSCDGVKVEPLGNCKIDKKNCVDSKSDGEETNSRNSDDTKDGDDKGTTDRETVKNCYIKCSDILGKEHDCNSPRSSEVDVGKDSKEDKDGKNGVMAVDSGDSQSTGVQCRKRKSSRKLMSKSQSAESIPAKKQKTSSSSVRDDADSSHSMSNQSNASDDLPSQTTNAKPTSVTKVSKPVPSPLSDCEAKVAARHKETKGKVRTGSLSSVLENKPLNRVTSEARRKRTREPYVQDGPCYDVTPKLMKCRECKLSNGQRNSSQLANNIFCRFYAFRKLCYSAKGLVSVSGFCKPSDADADDIELWLPVAVTDRRFTVDKAKYTIAILSDSFIKLLQEEQEAADLGKAHESKVVWKRAIQGVREMCDSCDATLFNVHWTCAKCGFAVCVDCYRARHASEAEPNEWLTCSANKQPHDVKALMMTQIIPSDILSVVSRMLKDVMTKWQIRSLSKGLTENGGTTSTHHMNGIRTKTAVKSARKKRSAPKDDRDSTGSSTPSSVTSSAESRVNENGCNGFDVDMNDGDHSEDGFESSPRSTSKLLDSGRLLRITESILKNDDLTAFQQHWQKAMPVIVSRPDIWYRADIWRPSALAKCGGYPAIDEGSGTEIAAIRYWDQFDRVGKGAVAGSSTVCSKDWPSPDDLSSFTTHLRDLDNGLPLPEYTRFGGVLHSMSHLPEYFVRPELSTLRIQGHGTSVSGQISPCSKLRVDSADTVNTAVFVSGDEHECDLQNPSISSALGDTALIAKLIQSCTKSVSKPVSAVWHVFRPQDADVIREFVIKVAGSGQQEALSETNSYLDASLRSRLATEHSVFCSTVVQCLGDTIFVPAMAPYQVCAVQNCIIASREFLSPESLRYCHNAGNSRRNRSSKSNPINNFEDQLQGKNLIYHTVKDAIAVLKSADP